MDLAHLTLFAFNNQPKMHKPNRIGLEQPVFYFMANQTELHF